MSKRMIIAFFALTAIVGAQGWTNTVGGTFVDISTTGGTAITNAGDDSNHGITSTVGNAWFPAGACTIGNNGALLGGSTTGAVGFTNVAIATSGLAITGTGVVANLCPWWTDLYPETGHAATTMYWQESAGVLYVMWKDDNHYFDATVGAGITFEIQVFDASLVVNVCDPRVQFLYSDTTFTGTYAANSNGVGATIGFAHVVGVSNAVWSQPTTGASVAAGTVLTLNPGSSFVISSPGGAGSGTVQLDFNSCNSVAYFIPYTLVAGAYPTGWLYGLDISLPGLISIWNTPGFVGGLPLTVGATLYSGFQFWMCAIGLSGTLTPVEHYTQTYIIP